MSRARLLLCVAFLLCAAFPASSTLFLGFPGGSAFGQTSSCVGQADVGFQLTDMVNLAAAPRQILVTDLNENGDLDVVVSTTDPAIGLLLGDGTGQLSPPTELSVGHPVRDILHIDLTADNFRDLIIGSSDGAVVIATGDGGGNFSVTQTIPTGTNTGHIAVGDVNGDGHNDLVVHAGNNAAGIGQLAVYPGTAAGPLGAPTTFPSAAQPDIIELADMNDDGFLDVVIGDFSGVGTTFGQVLVHTGTGAGTFGAPASIVSGYAGAFRLANLNLDAVPDLVLVGPSTQAICGTQLDVYLSGIAGHTLSQSFVGGCGPYSPLISDLDRDGEVDLAFGDGGDFVAATNVVVFAPGDGTGVFGAPCYAVEGLFWAVAPDSFTASDLDQDGRPDLVAASVASNQVRTYLGESNSTDPDFVRGDCNTDGSFNVADAVRLLSLLFPSTTPSSPLACEDACDGNDDGNLNLADAVSLLSALFGSPPAPLPAPSTCGGDPTSDSIGCDSFSACP